MSNERLVLSIACVAGLLFTTIFCGVAIAQSGDEGRPQFNHTTTGFILDGAHSREPCESCHTQAQFRGTPRDCKTCHQQGGRAPGKSSLHIPTSLNCDSCHFSASWEPANFQHRLTQGTVQGACSTCHNGVYISQNAQGKSMPHIPTTQSCDICHRTGFDWLPVKVPYGHIGVVPGSCANCHNPAYPGLDAKPSNHIPTFSLACDACHRTVRWTLP